MVNFYSLESPKFFEIGGISSYYQHGYIQGLEVISYQHLLNGLFFVRNVEDSFYRGSQRVSTMNTLNLTNSAIDFSKMSPILNNFVLTISVYLAKKNQIVFFSRNS